MTETLESTRSRWIALVVLCVGMLMIVLDATIVNVALPSIRQDLDFSQTSLAWVVNAYLLTYGGFLLLGGRLGDLFGHRLLFLSGITLFTAASLVCGLSTTQGMLIAARSVQGLGGADLRTSGLCPCVRRKRPVEAIVFINIVPKTPGRLETHRRHNR